MQRCREIGFALALSVVVAGCAGSGSGVLTSPGRDTPAMSTATLQTRSETGSRVQRKAPVVKIGLMLPLSGPGQSALIAETMKKAAEMALAEARAPHVSLVVRDDKGSADGAAAAARDLTAEGVEVVLGPLFSASVKAAQPVVRQANVPLLAFSNDRQVAGNNVALLSFLVEPEVSRVLAYAASQGRKRMAVLSPDDGYGRQVEAMLSQTAAQHAISIVARQTYPSEQPNGVAAAVNALRDQLRGIEEHGDPVTALFLVGGEEAVGTLAPHLTRAQIDPKRMQVIGTGAFDYAAAGREPFMLGAWFAAPEPKGWTDFVQRYAQQNGHAPPRIAGLAYDAMVAAVALSNGPDGARYTLGELSRPAGFEGLDGTFRFRGDGTVERPLAILEVQANGARVIDQAPQMASAPASKPGAAAASGVLSAIPSAFPASN